MHHGGVSPFQLVRKLLFLLAVWLHAVDSIGHWCGAVPASFLFCAYPCLCTLALLA